MANGTLLILSSAVFMTIANTCLKIATEYGYTCMELLSYRCGFQLLASIGVAILSSIKIKDPKNNFWNQVSQIPANLWPFVALRGIIGCFASSCFIKAYSMLPLGDANVILNMNPIVTAFFGYVLLNEIISSKQIVSAMMCISGVIMIVQPPFMFGSENDSDININTSQSRPSESQNDSMDVIYDTTAIGYMYAILGAMIVSMSFIMVRKLQHVPSLLLLMSHGLFTFFYSTMIHLYFETNDSIIIESESNLGKNDRYSLIIVACFVLIAYLAQCGFNKGVQILPASKSSLLNSTEIIWSYLGQIVFFNVIPNFLNIIGACIILFSTVFMSFDTKISNKTSKIYQTEIETEKQKLAKKTE